MGLVFESASSGGSFAGLEAHRPSSPTEAGDHTNSHRGAEIGPLTVPPVCSVSQSYKHAPTLAKFRPPDLFLLFKHNLSVFWMIRINI